MKVNFMTQLAVIAALFTSSTEGNIFKDGQCCLSCTEPKEKYYSIDKIHNMCGEACMDPKDYWLYKLFEPGLAKDEKSNSPCSDRDYTLYDSTVTHGFWNIKMTLDLYEPSPSKIYKGSI